MRANHDRSNYRVSKPRILDRRCHRGSFLFGDDMTQHTPGPWAVEDPMEWELSIVEAGKPTHEWQFIATVTLPDEDGGAFSREVCEANARLIAAAPRILDALINVQKIISEGAMTGFVPTDGDWAERLFASQQKTSQAIAEATGAA